MWKLLFESVVGSSHEKTGIPCQDSCLAKPIDRDGEDILVIACSDGAGSADLSHFGSRAACDAFVQIASESISGGLDISTLNREVVVEWFRAVQQALTKESESRGVECRRLACTLLTAIIGRDAAIFAQVGDGAIVIRNGDSFLPALWPQCGEYANLTNFVTGDDMDQVLEFVQWPTPVAEVAVFTDGLQRMALNFAEQSAHSGFFDPMFQALRATNETSELSIALRGFLASAQINERTDDDKTLVLATAM